jgi:hypothetical protein
MPSQKELQDEQASPFGPHADETSRRPDPRSRDRPIAPDQDFLTQRFGEEYRRYVFGVAEPAAPQAEPRSFSAAGDEPDGDLQEVGRNDAGPLQLGERTQDEAGPSA